MLWAMHHVPHSLAHRAARPALLASARIPITISLVVETGTARTVRDETTGAAMLYLLRLPSAIRFRLSFSAYSCRLDHRFMICVGLHPLLFCRRG